MEVNFSKIEKYPDLGNGLAATRDLGAGDVIIQVKDPLVLVVRFLSRELWVHTDQNTGRKHVSK